MENPVIKRKRYNWPAVYPQRDTKGQIKTYVVDLGLQEVPGESSKKRVRHFYDTLQEAKTKAEQLRIGRKNEGLKAVILPSTDRVELEQAKAILEPLNTSLVEAAKFYAFHFQTIQQKISVWSVVSELIASKEQLGRAGAYLDDLRARLNVFSRCFSDRPILEISALEIDQWLSRFSSVNRNNYRRLLSVLFGFALKRKYVIKNPVKEIDIATVKVEKPGILTVPEVRALIGAASDEFLPAIVLQLFAGLRPEAEVWRLEWKNINLQERWIDVTSSKNTASHRYVKIEDNLAAWLAPYAHKRGPVCLTDEPYFRRMREARTAAAANLGEQNQPAPNLTDWPSDCLRHCFASYHCGHFRDSRRTSEEMGHSGDLTVFNNHYRNRTKPAEAAAYWAIMPARVSAFPSPAAGGLVAEAVKGGGYRPGSETEAAILASRLNSAGLP